MVKYTKDQEIRLRMKKYSDKVNRKVGSLLWKEDNKFLDGMRKSIDKSEKSLNITDKKIIKKLDIFCLQLIANSFYINGNTFIWDDGKVSSRGLKSFNEKHNSSKYGGFKIKNYKEAYDFELLGDNFSLNKFNLKQAMEHYVNIIGDLKRDHKNIRRFLKLFATLTISKINKMSKEELISYFRGRKIKISPF